MQGNAPVTEQEMQEVLAREMPVDIRLAGRMPGKAYRTFHDTEQTLAVMYEKGLIDKALYHKVQNDRFGFKTSQPAASAGDFIEKISNAKNSTPLLALVSQAAGAKRIGDDVVAIRRDEIPGMDARRLSDIIMEPQVREEMTFQGGMEVIEMLAKKRREEGSIEDEEFLKVMSLSKEMMALISKLTTGNDASQ